MDTPTPSSLTLIDDLLAFGDLKVWSVLVTIFGDLATGEGADLPGPFLSTISNRMGIRTEAQRVALHRLRKDGWITVKKDGRVSRYGLSPLARSETEAVQSRVFDVEVTRPERCFLVLSDSAKGLDPKDGAMLDNCAVLTFAMPARRAGLLVSELAVTDLPGWARDKVLPPETQEQYERLISLLDQPIDPTGLTPVDRLALRLLVLHRWRRLVLSHSRTAAHLMGPDWSGNRCRARVHEILSSLPRPVPPFEHAFRS